MLTNENRYRTAESILEAAQGHLTIDSLISR